MDQEKEESRSVDLDALLAIILNSNLNGERIHRTKKKVRLLPEMKQKELLKTDGEYIYIKKLIKKEKKTKAPYVHTCLGHICLTILFLLLRWPAQDHTKPRPLLVFRSVMITRGPLSRRKNRPCLIKRRASLVFFLLGDGHKKLTHDTNQLSCMNFKIYVLNGYEFIFKE